MLKRIEKISRHCQELNIKPSTSSGNQLPMVAHWLSFIKISQKCYASASWKFRRPGREPRWQGRFAEQSDLEKFIISIWWLIHEVEIRAVDPDPHAFSLLDPDPAGKIGKCKEIGNNCNFFKLLKCWPVFNSFLLIWTKLYSFFSSTELFIR